MKTPYYEVHIPKGMQSIHLKNYKRKESAEKFVKEYEVEHGIKPHISMVVAQGLDEVINYK